MKAMILAAGLGTRLRPLTLVRPKALAPVMGTTVLEFWTRRLVDAGCEGIAVNASHLHGRIVEAVREMRAPTPIQVRVEPFLLGTGGGIRNALDFFGDDPFLVINGDILCNIPPRLLQEEHVRSGASVSMLLHDCEPFNNVAVRSDGAIAGFGEEARKLAEADAAVRLMAFTGIHCLDPDVPRDLPPVGFAEIIPVYNKLIAEGRPPRALFAPGLFWREMGSIDAYWAIHKEAAGLPEGFFPPLSTGERVCIAPGAWVAEDVRMEGVVAIGRGARIGEGCALKDVILWDDVIVEAGSRLTGCIATDGARIRGAREGEIILGETS